MGTKQVRLDEDVYAKIADEKRPDETFSEVIDRLIDEWSLSEFDMGLSTSEHEQLQDAIDAVEKKPPKTSIHRLSVPRTRMKRDRG
jgi:predicted CopG family antitoxin